MSRQKSKKAVCKKTAARIVAFQKRDPELFKKFFADGCPTPIGSLGVKARLV